jgi:hypothetical protein
MQLNRRIGDDKREFDRLNNQVLGLVGQRVLERAQAAAGVASYAVAAIALPEAALSFFLARSAAQRIGMSFLAGIAALNIPSDIDSILEHMDQSREITERLRPTLSRRWQALNRMRTHARQYYQVLPRYQRQNCREYNIMFFERG